jgi:hypothetical protein
MLSRWWIFKESIRAGMAAFRTTRRILSAAPAPSPGPIETGKDIQEIHAAVRGQMAAAVGENDPLLRLMDATFDYLSSNAPKEAPASVPGGENVVPFPGPGRAR